MKKLVVYLSLLTVSLAFFNGCEGGAPRPDNFPKVVSFQLKITKDGTPLPGAEVELVAEQNIGVAVGGTTDASGLVKLKTVQGSYAREGAPEGAYKCVVVPAIKVEGELPESELAKMSLDESSAYTQAIEEKRELARKEIMGSFSSKETTKLAVSVQKEGFATLDIMAE
ncbi:MAG: hypothetical protein Q4G68_02995 [Planctomycetia bacterium]|nr:hypothetical protein [Planctomycetia bacterium]